MNKKIVPLTIKHEKTMNQKIVPSTIKSLKIKLEDANSLIASLN